MSRKPEVSTQSLQSKSSKKQQKKVYKGIYISNERRKGQGGRIKCEQFDNKIEVMNFNPAIHESEVEWVEIRRYKKGQKRENTRGNKEKYNNKEFNKLKNTKKNNEVKKEQNKDNIKEKKEDKGLKKYKLKEDKKQPLQKTKEEQTKLQDKQQKIQQQQKQQQQIKEKDTEQREGIENEQTESDMEQQKQLKKLQQQTKSEITNNQTTQEPKTQEPVKQEQQVVQEIIVGKIIKQTNIIYKEKKFVGILTCEKKQSVKQNKHFVDKQMKPMDKIMQDYFLDILPIHSRLPKMELDRLVKNNIKVLNDYIEQSFPEKGKQLTKKKLNQILDVIQSIYVVATFNLWEGDRAFANIHEVIGKTMTIDGQCNCFLYEHHLNDFNYKEEVENIQLDKKPWKSAPLKIINYLIK